MGAVVISAVVPWWKWLGNKIGHIPAKVFKRKDLYQKHDLLG